jgi:transcriptional regulator with XRE-family HTH domain
MARRTKSARNLGEGPHPLDSALGSRIRLRRKELNLSQDQLARAVGITFQQVQKYEHGYNRISFSRLAEMCQVLDCSISDIVEGLVPSKFSSPASKRAANLSKPGASDLLRAYVSIRSPTRRQAVLGLAKQLANERADSGLRKTSTTR